MLNVLHFNLNPLYLYMPKQFTDTNIYRHFLLNFIQCPPQKTLKENVTEEVVLQK